MKVLIIRTLKSELIPRVIKKIKMKFSNCSLYLLTHNNQDSLSFFSSKFHKVFNYNSHNDFNLNYINKNLLNELKIEKFDLIILPKLFNSKHGFLEVIRLGIAINPKKIAILPIRNKLIFLNKNFLRKYFIIKIFSHIVNLILQIIFWPIFLLNLIFAKIF